jgi:hypothetical protein
MADAIDIPRVPGRCRRPWRHAPPRVTRPTSLLFLSLDELIKRIEVVVAAKDDGLRAWAVGLTTRYANV